ncbi:hypothetical protein GCK72_011335 [Caenorhabditis remanei]|uniref:RING-type domain-containing protein n=1 Tax=Caenorhabditis remanei TaxID=31234 RepID=A0A6A5H5G6_CAERE|nr:hypothetical protein GCK72_011335 [Caenorhabditis remanei]KAF1763070.1 hypothetical protein GCK72_011335 [Caenorhabditis remanei]
MNLPYFIHCNTTRLQLLNVFVTACLLFTMGYFIANDVYPEHTWRLIIVMLIGIFAAAPVGLTVRNLRWCLDRKYRELGEYGKTRRNMMIWTGGISVIGTIHLVVVYAMDMNVPLFISTQFLTSFFTLLHSLCMIYGIPMCNIRLSLHTDVVVHHFLIHICVFIVFVISFYVLTPRFTWYPVIYHVYYVYVYGGSMVDFQLVYTANFGMGNKEGGAPLTFYDMHVDTDDETPRRTPRQVPARAEPARAEPEPQQEQPSTSGSSESCKICHAQLQNTSQVCFIKRQCDHVICLSCSKKISSDKDKNTASWQCPYCKLLAVVNGNGPQREKDEARKQLAGGDKPTTSENC